MRAGRGRTAAHATARPRRATGPRDDGFLLFDALVALAVLALLVTLLPQALVQSRQATARSSAVLEAREAARSVLASDLAGVLRVGTFEGVSNGRPWRATVAPAAMVAEAAAEGDRRLLHVRLALDVDRDRTLSVDTFRIGGGR